MAVVYEALDERLKRRVALKFLPEEYTADPVALDRFRREAQTASSLNHPGICSIYDIGDLAGRPFIVMELLAGQSLRELIRTSAPLSLPDILSLAHQILDALGTAHEKGIVHRDIKPENIFITDQGRVKLLDFGLARPLSHDPSAAAPTQLTTPGLVLGTMLYMSPEQLRGEPVDQRTDIYSAALTFYEMATGVLPTRCPTIAQTMATILREDPSPPSQWVPSIPPEFDRIVLQALSKDRASRPASVPEFSRRMALIQGVETPPGTLLAVPSPLSSSLGSSRQSGGSVNIPSLVSLTGSWFRTELVGRKSELQAIQSSLELTRHGRGKLVLLEGEPGIGKTTIMNAVMEEAVNQGFLVLPGRCPEMDPAAPYLPFAEMLEHLLRARPDDYLKAKIGDLTPELTRLSPQIGKRLAEGKSPLTVPPEQERYLLFSSFAEVVERLSHDAPVLLVIEDLHWADQPTAHLLEHLASRIHSLPVLVLGSLRNDPLAQSGTLSICRELIRRNRAELHRLAPLTAKDVSQLLTSRMGHQPPDKVGEAIYGFTEGNPFFVEEICRLLEDENRLFDSEGKWRPTLDLSDLTVPEGVRILLHRRLERLGTEAAPLLQVAALIGREFPFNLLQCATEGRWGTETLIEVLEKAEQSGLISSLETGDDIAYCFSHALVRQALIDNISLPRRRQWHLRIADVIETSAADDHCGSAGRLAYHLNRAGSMAPPDRRLAWTLRAGDQALETTAFEEAIRLYSAALSIKEIAELTRAELLFKRGLAQTGLRDWKAAQEDWHQALPVFEASGAVAQVSQICSVLAAQFIWTGTLLEARSISRRGLAATGDEPSADRCRLLAWAGHSFNQKGELEEGDRLTQEAFQLAQELGDPPLLGHVLTHRACQAFYSMHFRDQAELALRAGELLEASPWDRAEAWTISHLGLLHLGELERARWIGKELTVLAEKIGHLGSLWMVSRVEGLASLIESGDLNAFEAFARRDLEVCRKAGIRWISEAHVWLGQVEFWRGNWDLSESHFLEGVRLEPDDFTKGLDTAAWLLSLAYRGRSKEPVAAYQKFLASPTPPRTTGECSFALSAVEGSLLLHRKEIAAKLYPVVLQILEHGNKIRFNACGLIESVAGMAAAAAGHWEASEKHFLSALHQAEVVPYRQEQAEVRRWYAWMLLQRDGPGDLQPATQFAEEASRIYTELGMPEHHRISLGLIRSRQPSS